VAKIMILIEDSNKKLELVHVDWQIDDEETKSFTAPASHVGRMLDRMIRETFYEEKRGEKNGKKKEV